MEHDAKYVTVGIFVILVIAAGIGFVFWYSDVHDSRDYNIYEIYFTGSVSGLDQGSVVRYLGVDVGRVRRMTIDRKDAVRVKVVAEIDSSAPITSATRASLGLQGVTGLLYVNLKDQPGEDDKQPLQQGDRYAVIESIPSDFDALLSSLPVLVARATTLIDKVNAVFSDDNLNTLNDTLQNLHAATQGLPATAKDINELIRQLQAAVGEIKGASTSLHAITDESRPEIRHSLQKFSAVADNLAQTSVRLDRFVADSEAQLGQFRNHGLFEVERLLRDTRNAAREFRELSRSLRENPSQLLYEPQKGGVDIPR